MFLSEKFAGGEQKVGQLKLRGVATKKIGLLVLVIFMYYIHVPAPPKVWYSTFALNIAGRGTGIGKPLRERCQLTKKGGVV